MQVLGLQGNLGLGASGIGLALLGPAVWAYLEKIRGLCGGTAPRSPANERLEGMSEETELGCSYSRRNKVITIQWESAHL